jgi:hypothetical protein
MKRNREREREKKTKREMGYIIASAVVKTIGNETENASNFKEQREELHKLQQELDPQRFALSWSEHVGPILCQPLSCFIRSESLQSPKKKKKQQT